LFLLNQVSFSLLLLYVSVLLYRCSQAGAWELAPQREWKKFSQPF